MTSSGNYNGQCCGKDKKKKESCKNDRHHIKHDDNADYEENFYVEFNKDKDPGSFYGVIFGVIFGVVLVLGIIYLYRKHKNKNNSVISETSDNILPPEHINNNPQTYTHVPPPLISHEIKHNPVSEYKPSFTNF